MKQINVRKAVMIICLFGIVICLLLFIPQIRQIIIGLAGQFFRGRELSNQRLWNNVLRFLAICGCVFLPVLLFLIWKYKITSKHFFQMTNGLLYSGEAEISGIEAGKTIPSMLINKLKSNSWLVFSIFIVFFIILVFFTAAHPVIPYVYDPDDWFTLSVFRHPVPLPFFSYSSSWIPSRLFTEFLGPLAGLFAGYIVNPVLGDYLASISFTVALIMAGFTTIFYWSLYRLFLTLSGNKMVSILSGLIILCLYFGFFKTQTEGSQYMLYAYNLATYFAYTIPYLLNSICVCLLMHYAVCGTHISGKGLGRKTFSVFALALYFAIFSVLFSVIILAVYCFWKLLITVIHKERLTKNLILIIILVGFFYYALLEYTSDRAEYQKYWVDFSLGYLRLCKEALMNLLGLFGKIHKGLLLLTVSINIFAMILLSFNMSNDKNKPLVKTGIISLLSFGSLVPAMVMLAGKIGSYFYGNIMYMHSIFFYYILFSVLSLVYTVTKLRKQVVLFFFLVFVFLETTNTTKPYLSQRFIYSNLEGAIVTHNWIEQMKIADKSGAESVYIPEYPDPSNPWPIVFSNALYVHGITSRKITILGQQDREMTE